MKRKFFSIMLTIIASISLFVGIGMFQFTTFASTESTLKYYQVDDVYSSFNAYASGPAYAGKTPVIVARGTQGTTMELGVTLNMPANTSVDTTGKSLIVDVNVYMIATHPYFVKLVLSDGTTISATGSIYTAYNNTIVSQVTADATAKGYILGASTGYNKTTTPSKHFNRLVVPFSSFEGVSGTVSVKAVTFTVKPTENAVPKFTLGLIGVAESTATSVGSVSNICTPASDNFETVTPTRVKTEYLNAGEFLIYAGNTSSSASNDVTSQVLFKMPDALIGADGLVDTSKLKGIVFDIGSDLDVTNDMSVQLFATNDATAAFAVTGYAASLKTVVAKDGTISNPTSKYFSKDHANCLHLLNLKSTESASASASFCQGALDGGKISPFFAINVPKGKNYYGEKFTINSVKIIADDTVYSVTTEGGISASHAKGFVGTEIILKSSEDVEKIDQVTVNGVALTAQELSSLCSNAGLKVVMNGNLNVVQTTLKAYEITASKSTGGTLTLSQPRADAGEKIRVLIDVEGGYKLKSLKVNATDVTADVVDNYYVIGDVQSDCNVVAEFEQVGEYYYEKGDMGSLYNSYPGVSWADENAVNVNVIKEWNEEDSSKTVGVTAKNISASVSQDSYIVIKMQHLRNFKAGYNVAVNGEVATADYHYVAVDKNFKIVNEATASKISLDSVKYTATSETNETNVYTATGFNGYIVVPLSAFGEIQTVNSISIFANLQSNYTRFNLYSISIVDKNGINVDGSPMLNKNDTVWLADEDNFEFYGTDSTYANVRYLEKGEVVIDKIVHANNRDAMWWIAPSDLIGEDGYVDFAQKGVKGILIDLENYNYSGIVFALRIVGAESAAMNDFALHNVWQTSQSNHPGLWIYENGLVRPKSTANFPYDDITGTFNGQWYIPLDTTGFTSLYTGTEYSTSQFPSKVQPIFRLVVGTTVDEEYSFKINSIKFITDDSDLKYGAVTSSTINGKITGTFDGRNYAGTENNKFICGTQITLNVTPDEGYVISSAKYTLAGATESTAIQVAETGGSFSLTVSGDIVVQVICDAKEYSITYDLGGGTLEEGAETSYTIEDDKIILKSATKKGYNFVGWFDAEGNQVTEIAEGSTGDIVLIAKWTKSGCVSNLNGKTLWGVASLIIVCSLALVVKRKKQN